MYAPALSSGCEWRGERLHRAQQSDRIKSRVKTPCPGVSAFEVGCGILLWSEGSDGEREGESRRCRVQLNGQACRAG